MTSAVLRMTSASLGSGGATPPHALARGVWSAVKGVFVGSGSDGCALCSWRLLLLLLLCMMLLCLLSSVVCCLLLLGPAAPHVLLRSPARTHSPSAAIFYRFPIQLLDCADLG
eukprot:COSAG05_NODE_294_length_11993_cov_75.643181_6_plen_113_part_00